MELAISSIGWERSEEPAVAALLQDLGVTRVELAPTKIWEDPTTASLAEIDKELDFWSDYDITPVAFQSMLFARPDLKLFESQANRQETLKYLRLFITQAGKMGVGRMVFGSPGNRRLEGSNPEVAEQNAIDFFAELGATAHERDVVFCIEPNPPAYRCEFITNAAQGKAIVEKVASPGFGLHLDIAGMTLAGDDPAEAIRSAGPLLRHFHISAPYLGAVEDDLGVDHRGAAAALREIGYDQTVSIEMRSGDDDAGGNLARIERAVRFAQEVYLTKSS